MRHFIFKSVPASCIDGTEVISVGSARSPATCKLRVMHLRAWRSDAAVAIASLDRQSRSLANDRQGIEFRDLPTTRTDIYTFNCNCSSAMLPVFRNYLCSTTARTVPVEMFCQIFLQVIATRPTDSNEKTIFTASGMGITGDTCHGFRTLFARKTLQNRSSKT